MYSILVVDDEPLIIKGIRIVLERSGLPIKEIREAENGVEALNLIEAGIPDILMTDIRMPKMDGLELCRIINEKDYKTSLIIISGYDDFKYAQEAIRYGARDYLLKPVQQAELLKTVSSIIRNYQIAGQMVYIAHQEFDLILNQIEAGLWDNNPAGLEEGMAKVAVLLREAPMEYCVKTAQDLANNLSVRISSRIGDSLMIPFSTPHDIRGKDFFKWFSELLEEFRVELEERRENTDYHLFESAKQYIKDNYNRDITLEMLAHRTGFSPNYFSQLFKLKTGRSFVQYRSEIRIKKAMELLCQPDKTVTQVAMEVGYNDITHFIRAFKDFCGMTPNEFKRKRGLK